MNYFTSDIHLGSNQIIINENRPFSNADKFKKFLIRVWNKQATKNDTIYIIGDLFDCHDNESNQFFNELTFIKKINANIILIVGNNEERIIKTYFKNDFNQFKDLLLKSGIKDVLKQTTLLINGEEFFLTHKPINTKKQMLNLFGHSHRAMGIYKSFGFNVSIDLNHFHLYSEKDISFLLQLKRNYWDIDNNLKLI